MLIIISQVVLLLIAVALPIKSRKERDRKLPDISRFYRVDTDTSGANYAVNEFGTLERINRNSMDENPKVSK